MTTALTTEDRQWITGLYALTEPTLTGESQRGSNPHAIDMVYRHLDDLLLAGDLGRCDTILAALDPARMRTSVALSALAITRDLASDLPSRAGLIDRAERVFRERGMSDVDDLLGRFR